MNAFANLRVIELTDVQADLCGRLLADMGAVVTKIEPPGGSVSRHHPPLARSDSMTPLSLLWWSFNLGKHSVELDLETDAGRTAFLDLVRDADVLVESRPPGEMSRLGLGFDSLSLLNPGLIQVSVSPYGQQGPKVAYRADDLTSMAAGGLLFITGDEDRPPVMIGAPQSYAQAGAQAAVAALFAWRQRQRSARGQYIDLSAQEAVVNTLNNTQQQWERRQRKVRRGREIRLEGMLHLTLRDIYPCKDGDIAWRIFLGPRSSRLRPLIAWLKEEGLGASFGGYDFERMTMADVTQEQMDAWNTELSSFFLRHSKSELFERAVAEGIMLFPLSSPADLLAEPHLMARHAWQTIEDPLLGSVRVPRAAVTSPLEIQPRGVAPVVPETTPTSGATKPATAKRNPANARQTLPFEGIRVLDFGWAMAGPVTTKYLAMFGADVLKIESRKRLDGTRGPSIDHSTYFANHNISKRSVTIDMSTNEGQQVARDLAAHADLVMDNFAPGQMKRWGLDYAALSTHIPRIITVSASMMGATGPKARHPGFGSLLQAYAGINYLTGWSDRGPIGPVEPYPDMIAPWYALAAIVAALERRDTTGLGCALDVSQLEAVLQFLTPALVEQQVNQRAPARQGNRSATLAPHGVYPTSGDDEWVAISVLDDAMWRRLADVTEIETFLDPALATAGARKQREDDLDQVLAAWTRGRNGWELETTLQQGGVAASVVEDGSHLHDDEQLRARGHFAWVEHPAIGRHSVDGPAFRMSETEPRISHAPMLGEHTEVVLREVADYDEDQISSLMARNILV